MYPSNRVRKNNEQLLNAIETDRQTDMQTQTTPTHVQIEKGGPFQRWTEYLKIEKSKNRSFWMRGNLCENTVKLERMLAKKCR